MQQLLLTSVLTAGFIYGSVCLASDVPESLVGRWSIATEVGVNMPPRCAESTLEFTRDGRLIVTSGALVYSAAIKVRTDHDKLIASLSILKHNGMSNCQGIPADWVTTHLAPLLLLHPVGDELEFAMGDEKGKVYGAAVRLRRTGDGEHATNQSQPRAPDPEH